MATLIPCHYIKKEGWLINNGIHPGEPDGIDASMIFAKMC